MTSLMRMVVLVSSAAALIAACDSSVDTTPGPTGSSSNTTTTATTGAGGTATSTNTGGAGGSSTSSSGAGGNAWEDCFGADGKYVQSALNVCDQNTVCEMVEHQIDCCGNVMLVGIDAAQKAQFEACEAAWGATLPECDCPMGLPQIQQPYGETVNSASDAIVDCLNWTMSGGVCITVPK